MIWFVATEDVPVLALLIYGKNEQADPSPEQRRAMLAVIGRLKHTVAARRLKGAP